MNFTRPRDTQIARYPLLLDVSVGVFPEETSIGIGGLSETVGPLQCVCTLQSTEDLNRTKRQRKIQFVPCLPAELGHSLSSSHILTT